MTKKDVRTGMFGVMDNGFRFVIADDLIVYQNGEFDYFSDVTVDLQLRFKKISQLYDCQSFNQLDDGINGNSKFPCIWDRDKRDIEMTISEIEKRLGIKNLKIIKEDN